MNEYTRREEVRATFIASAILMGVFALGGTSYGIDLSGTGTTATHSGSITGSGTGVRIASGPLALLLGAVLVLLQHFLAGTFQTDSEVRRTIAGMPVYASIPRGRGTDDARPDDLQTMQAAFMTREANSGFVEAFRTFSLITERMEDPRYFRLIPDDARVFFVTAAHFARGAFAPETPDGLRLLAHELAHVAQARHGRAEALRAGVRTSRPDDSLEREAEGVAARVERTLGGSGAPRPPAADPLGARALEARLGGSLSRLFGSDLTGARIHPDSPAVTGTTKAVARNGEIHFRPGAYRPGTAGGDWLIAHELAHVVQQRGDGGGRAGTRTELEREADRAASRVVRGLPAEIALRAPAGRPTRSARMRSTAMRPISVRTTVSTRPRQRAWVRGRRGHRSMAQRMMGRSPAPTRCSTHGLQRTRSHRSAYGLQRTRSHRSVRSQQ